MLTKLVSLGKINSMCFRSVYQYNVFGAPFEGLDPAKHIYMNKGLQNQYDDLFRLGDYPYVNDYPIMIDSQQYVPQIAQLVESHVKQQFQNATFTAGEYNNGDVWAATWNELGVNNFKVLVPNLLLRLSETIVVKESKWTWTKEQRYRLHVTQTVLGPQDYTQMPTYYFINDYNTVLWMLARQSNQWTSPAIRGVQTPLEKQLLQDLQPKPKIQSLFRDRPENNTFLNRLLKAVHQ
ncbi:unnamed protein product (macronuclear) [Paramecium tetraurelia]|uniref:Uncharacterized protein n=1 Tax=Paramecium tetraurelia TaxID=5888 RepID=A0BX46_PARTE|nr:uncharacterized protein GSPATT00032965001 [Paramecium tetraurelia]CAK63113.1 unnamed protein product [Paramecium tetraurelia]|eukprot:XP_001430511.1 hypothetical protein (macronuclear) [Paramecium tetraurelia strain d4-2]